MNGYCKSCASDDIYINGYSWKCGECEAYGLGEPAETSYFGEYHIFYAHVIKE